MSDEEQSPGDEPADQDQAAPEREPESTGDPTAEPTVAAGTKLQPAAIPIWFLYDTRRAAGVLIPLLVVGGALGPIVSLAAGALFIAPILRYTRFRYGFEGGTMTVEGGVLNRWRRVISRERVQSVNVVQKLRHRIFGVVEVRIEAIGGDQTEAALVAVTPDQAAAIRRWAAGSSLDGDQTQTEPSPPLAQLTPRDLLVAGITGGRVAVMAALLGYGQELLGEDAFDQVASVLGDILPGRSLLVIASAVLGGIVLALALSVALTVLVYWNFTVHLEEKRLIVTRGLLERRRATIPLHRVQAIQVEENFIRRPFGLASLKVTVAGYSSDGQEGDESSMLLPVGPRVEAWRMVCRILGAGNDLGSVRLTRPPGRSTLPKIVVIVLLCGTFGTASLLAGWPAGALAFLLIPAAGLAVWILWRCRGHALSEGFVLIRHGALVRRTHVVPESNIQHLQLSWTAIQGGLDLATVRLHIPGAERRAANLPRQVARTWFSRLGETAKG